MLKHSGLPQRRVDDIKLQVKGDLTKYEEIKAIILRIAKSDNAESFAYNLNMEDEWEDGSNDNWNDNWGESEDQ